MRKQVGIKLEEDLIARADAALAPGQTRTAWIEAAMEAALRVGAVSGHGLELEEPAMVHRLPQAPVLRGTVRRVAESDEIPLPAIAPRKPVEVRSQLCGASGRPEKPARLAVARSVKTSAEIKAGLRPIDWRGSDDAA